MNQSLLTNHPQIDGFHQDSYNIELASTSISNNNLQFDSAYSNTDIEVSQIAKLDDINSIYNYNKFSTSRSKTDTRFSNGNLSQKNLIWFDSKRKSTKFESSQSYSQQSPLDEIIIGSRLKFLTDTNIMISQNIDYYKYPADLNLSKERAKTKHIFSKEPFNLLKIFNDIESLKSYSYSFFLYLEIMKASIIILCIGFIVSGLFNLFANLFSGIYPDGASFLFMMSFNNRKRSDWMFYIQMTLNLFTIIIMRIYCRKVEKRDFEEYTGVKDDYTENCYCLLVKNLPSDVLESDIVDFFDEICIKENLNKVKGIIMLQDCSKLLKLRKEKKELLRCYIKVNREVSCQIFEYELEKLEILLKEEEEELKFMKRFQNTAIVCFENMNAIPFLLKSCKKNNSKFLVNRIFRKFIRFFFPSYETDIIFKNHKISLEKIGEPDDTIFENLHICSVKKRWLKIFSYIFLVIAIMFFCYLIMRFSMSKLRQIYGKFNQVTNIKAIIKFILGVEYIPTDINNDKIDQLFSDPEFSNFRTFMYATMIWLLYTLLQFIIDSLGFLQKYNKYVNIQIYRLKALLAVTFINYSIIFNLTKLIFPPADFLKQVVFVLFQVILINYFFKIVNIQWILMIIKRWRLRNKIIDYNMSQQEADKLYINPEFNFIVSLYNIAQLLYLILSFNLICPILSFFGIIILMITFIIDKFLILKRASISFSGIKMGLHFYRLWNFDIAIQIIAMLIFNLEYNPNEYLAGIILVAGVCYYTFIFEFTRGKRKKNKMQKFDTNFTYDNIKRRFKSTFWTQYQFNIDNRKYF